MYKLSIVIPIYKVENYIHECLESVLNQLPKYVQVICINDGTPDASMNIAKDLVETYSQEIQNQFLFIDQSNQGLGVARNTGINSATGEYIGFLDSDDKLMPGYFDNLLSVLNDNEYDIIEFNLITSNGIEIKTSSGSVKSVFSLSKWYSPARIYNCKLFEKTRFTPNILYEDLDLTPQLYINTKRITYIDLPLYWYRVNDSGITRSFSPANNIKTVDSLEFILKKYLTFYQNDKNSYYAIIIVHSYYLLCIASCRRFGLKKAFKYIDQYQGTITSLISINDLPVDNKLFNQKIIYLLKNPKAYCSAYIVFDYLRNKIKYV